MGSRHKSGNKVKSAPTVGMQQITNIYYDPATGSIQIEVAA